MTLPDFWRRLISAAVHVMVVLCALEGAMRLDDWARFGVPFSSHTIALGELLVTDSLGAHARADAQFRQFKINSMGFRGEEPTDSLRRTARLVVVSGASESFGLYESIGKEWPRQLEDSLRQGCATGIVVGNAAFAGMSLPTVDQDIRLRLARLRPAAIVYYPTPMQYLETELPVAATPSSALIPATQGRPRLRAVPRIRDAVKRVIPAPVLDRLRQREIRASRRAANSAPLDAAPSDRLDAFERGLRILVGSVRQVDAIPVLVVHQNRFFSRDGIEQQRWLRAWERFYPRFSGDAIIEFDRLAGERTRLVASDSGALLVNPSALLEAERPVPFADFSHFNDRGSAIVAGAVARALNPALCRH